MIQNSKTLIIVESPLQMLCAYEALRHFKPKSYIIFIRFSGQKRNDLQLEKLSELLFSEIKGHIKKVYIKSQNKSLFDFIKILYFKFNIQIKKFEYAILGNIDSGFIQIVTKKINIKKIILLDDGSKTLVKQKSFNSNFYYSYFTFYKLNAIKNQIIYKNNFKNLRLLLETKLNRNQILFIGSKMSEINIISEDKYIALIQSISLFFKKKQMIYVAHREENTEKLKKISDIENVKVRVLDFPIELLGFYESEIPQQIASFFSTALYTMHEVYKVDCISFKFSYQHHPDQTNFDTVYAYHSLISKVVEEADYA